MNYLNIAFDMDGVLRPLDLTFIRMAEAVNNEHAWKALELHILTQTKPQLNPGMFALQGDSIYCITNCSSENSANKKRRWLKHFFGDMVEILPVFGPKGAWGDDYYRPVAKDKLAVCYDNDIDIYFDDCPDIIRIMRELHKEDLDFGELPFIHFIKYGAWIEEGFE